MPAPAATATCAGLALLLLLASAPHGALGSRDGNEPPNPLGCACSDVDPRDDFTKVNVPYTCWEQAGFKGVCEQPFMMQTPEEVPEGYCQISCSRCDCCSTFASVLANKAPEFLWLLNHTDLGGQLSKPGYMATILAPRDDAVKSLLHSLGYDSRKQAEQDSGAKSKLAAAAKLHVLPPTSDLAALWTTPFMKDGARMYALNGNYLAAEENGGKIKVSGPKNSAEVTDRDIPVCKGFVDVLDKALYL